MSGGYHSFIQRLRPEPGRRLDVQFNFHKITSDIPDAYPLLELLCEEITLWSKVIGKRNLTSITLAHATRVLAGFELTHIMHCLARQFQINTDHKRFLVVAELDELNSELLALMRGLNFDAIRVAVTREVLRDPQQIQATINHIKAYTFSNIGIHIQHTDCLGDICAQIKEITQLCQPDYISLGDETQPIQAYTATTKEVLKEETTQIDKLQLGPEGIGRIHDIAIQNFCSLEKYRTALDSNRLPIHTG